MGELVQLALDQKVGDWRIIKKLGEGAFGAVYKCEDSKHPGDYYALKVTEGGGEDGSQVEAMDEKIQLLKMEVFVLNKLSKSKSGSRHFCKIVDKGASPTYNYVVMTFVGTSLQVAPAEKTTNATVFQDLINHAPLKRFSVGTALSVGMKCFEALEDLHNVGKLGKK